MQTIVCMKWGTLYPSVFVNNLYSSIQRNTQRETRLICYTDDSTGIDSGVITVPLPDVPVPDRVSREPWRKLGLWRSDLSDGDSVLSGDILFFDLDVVITGSIDKFFDYRRGEFCVIREWIPISRVLYKWPEWFQRVGNTSVFRFPFGKYSFIFDDYNSNPDLVLDNHRTEQNYVSSMIKDRLFWPKGLCESYKHSLLPFWPLNFFMSAKLPSFTSCVVFMGEPNPDDAAIGRYPLKSKKHLWRRIYKYNRPALWINEHWR